MKHLHRFALAVAALLVVASAKTASAATASQKFSCPAMGIEQCIADCQNNCQEFWIGSDYGYASYEQIVGVIRCNGYCEEPS